MKAAIITKYTIGDGLLMMIAAYRLYQQGYQVTVYNSLLSQLESWFFPCTFKTLPPEETFEQEFLPYDFILTYFHKGSYVKNLLTMRQKNKGFALHLFFLSNKAANSQFDPDKDHIFDPSKSMAHNISVSVGKLLGHSSFSKTNNLCSPVSLTHRKHLKRIVIHPTSNNAKKNWSKNRFVLLAKKLKKRGFDPCFCLGEHEKKHWCFLEEKGFLLKAFSSLSDLASYIYESGFVIGNDSGLVHLASNLNIPSITIAGSWRMMKLWQADWRPSKVIFASKWIPNCKGFRIRDKYWAYLIPTKKVEKAFIKLAKN